MKERYFVVNLLRAVDCIDKAKTRWEPNALDETKLTRVSNLTIDEARIPSEAQIFRPVGLRALMIARRDLVDDLRKANVTGFGTAELADFT